MANTISINVVADTARATSGLKSVTGQLSDVDNKTSKVGGAFKSAFALAGGAIAAAGIGKAFGSMIEGARESAKVTAITEQVIKTTGGAAGVTAGEVGKLATALSNKTAIDDELIQSGANVLLTFKDIRNEAGKGNDVFDRTVVAANDMSVAMGTSMKSASMQLGKALNDPVNGLSKLSRAGVTFTEQQKKQITAMQESGDMAGAQGIMLAELESQFGGTAAKVATPFDKLKVTLGNLGEEIGLKLLPYIDRASTWFAAKLPGAVAKAKEIFDRLVPVVTSVGEKIGAAARFLNDHRTAALVLAGAIGALVVVVQVHAAAMAVAAAGGMVAWLKGMKLIQTATKIYTAIQWAANLSLLGFPVVAVVAGVALLIGGLILAYKKCETFRRIVDAAFSFIKKVVKATIPTVVSIVKGGFALIKKVISTVLGAIKATVRAVWGAIKSTFSSVFKAVASIVKSVWGTIKSVFSTSFKAVASSVKSVWGTIKSTFSTVFRAVVGIVRSVWATIRDVFRGALDGLRSMVSDGFGKVVDVVRSIPGRLRNLAGIFRNVGSAIIGALVNGLAQAGGVVSDIAGNVWDAVRGMLNSAIGRINSALNFTIGIPGPDVHVSAGQIPYLASGGVATRATLAIVGEKGPEAIVPLDQLAAMIPAGGSSTVVYVQTTLGQTSAEVGRQLADHLRSYERTGGRVKLLSGGVRP